MAQTAPHESGSEDAPPPALSLAERDRRYRLARTRMAESGIDVLVLPASTARWEQTMADSRYLTGIGGFGTEVLTIFSPAHETTCYVFNRAGHWRRAQNWVGDVRDGRNLWADNVRERLGEIGFTRGRIGIAGLAGLTRTPDGIVPHRMVESIAAAFPAAQIVNATDLMRDLRAIKSAEEIAVMTRATAIAEAMSLRVRDMRPGATERHLYAAMIETLLVEGGELPAMLLLGSGPGIDHGTFVPSLRRLQANDLIVGEIEGRYAGYSGQVVRPAILGRASADYRDLLEIDLACFNDVLAALKPGTALSAVMATFDQAVARHGKGRCQGAYPLMHARGLGDETPTVLSAANLRDQADVRLEAGMVFVLKPRIERDGLPTVQLGDTVVVSENGGVRLGREKLALIEVPWAG